jgi:hypothetical protein
MSGIASKGHTQDSGRYTPHNPSPQPKLVAKKTRYITPTALSPKIYRFKKIKNEGMFI